MRPFYVAAVLMTALALSGRPATASTIPSLDFRQGQTTVSLGLADLSIDHALTDRLSIGFSGAYVLPAHLLLVPGSTVAIRATYHLLRLYNLDLGLMVSTGYGAFRFPGPGFLDQPGKVWWQPAFNVAIASPAPFEHWTPRLTLGPILWMEQPPSGFSTWFFLPNVELGYRLDPANELTLGGNSLIGWRRVF